MAPKTRGSSRGGAGMKRKRTVRRPAREPSPSSDSSSSSTPNAPPVGATSEVDHYASRVITTGRKFDFDLFEREGLLVGSQLKEMGFEKLCSLDCPTYPALVKEFYRNLSRGDNGLVSIVRGIGLNVTSMILSRLLELPLSGPSTYDPEDRSPALTRLLNRNFEGFEEVFANQLPLDLRLLHNICSRILFPKTGRFDYVSERDIFVMDAVVSGRPINLPVMILWHMADCGGKRKSCLPYGMILTELFRSQGIVISDSEPRRELRHTDFYSLATIHRMGFRKVNDNWIRRGQEEVRVDDVRAETEAGPSCSVPDTFEAGPAPPTVDPHMAGPSTSAAAAAPPPPPSFSVPAPESAEFSQTQLQQIGTLVSGLLAEQDRRRTEELKVISDKMDLILASLDRSRVDVSLELQSVVHGLSTVARRSTAYEKASTSLSGDIDFAIDQINSLLQKYSDIQKGEISELIGTIRRVLFKLGG